jgi:hypothetical protein
VENAGVQISLDCFFYAGKTILTQALCAEEISKYFDVKAKKIFKLGKQFLHFLIVFGLHLSRIYVFVLFLKVSL